MSTDAYSAHSLCVLEKTQLRKFETLLNNMMMTWPDVPVSLVASPMWPIGNLEMLSTSNFYGGNVIYMVWKDKLS